VLARQSVLALLVAVVAFGAAYAIGGATRGSRTAAAAPAPRLTDRPAAPRLATLGAAARLPALRPKPVRRHKVQPPTATAQPPKSTPVPPQPTPVPPQPTPVPPQPTPAPPRPTATPTPVG
jgi:hypothetical protein